MTTIVLVHGAFHGAWCWEALVPELAARGIDTVTVDLPLTGLDDDAAALTAVLDGLEGPVTLLGHSYGGMPVTAVGAHPLVERLVYLTAVAPDDGESIASGAFQVSDEFMSAFTATSEGVPLVDPARAAQIFYPDIDPAEADGWAARLRAGEAGGDGVIERAAWHDRPAHYVVCTSDPILPRDRQLELAERMGATVHEIAGDHSPFVARPAELAALLAAVATG